MGGGHEVARNLRQQEPGRDGRHANAAGTPKIAEADAPRHRRAGLYTVTPEGGEPVALRIGGREAWALDRLRRAGPQGCTPIEQPAPRWSCYVHRLRARGVPIETVTEPHGGEFAGRHGRYVLRANVRRVCA